MVELIGVTAILSIVLAGLTGVFISASHAEVDMNRRFQAQQQALLALDKLRREIHCARDVSLGSSSSITLTLDTWCPTGSGSVTWCTLPSGSAYALYRAGGGSCTSSGVKWAGDLTLGSVFSPVAQSPTSLAKVRVDLPVNVKPGSSVGTFRLVDDIVLRNSVRQ